MQIIKLKELYEQCRTNPSYQYRNLSTEEFNSKAVVSFDKLTLQQKQKVTKAWGDKLGTVENAEEAMTELKNYRFLAQTNLFFMCHLLESYNQTTLGTHEEICNNFFVQKDPTFMTFEQFANQYTDLKNRLLLVPRGGFKSSMDMADCVQWIVDFPEVTIGIITGTLPLAVDFVGEIKNHFTFSKTGIVDSKGNDIFGPRQIRDRITGEESDSLFQIIFYEHCSHPKDGGKQTEFNSAANFGDDREPNVRACSIEQNLTGSHFGILKLDDPVTNENSKTTTRIKDVNKQISINKGLMHPYGWFDVIGTWYDENDYYGATIKREERFAKEEGLLHNIKGSVDSGIFNSSVHFIVYLRACWWPTPEAVKAGKIEEEYKKEDLILWFPERLTYDYLKAEQANDSDQDADGDTGYFAIKFLNNPRKINKVKFPRELLIRRTIPHTQFPPQQGVVVTAVDAAYSIKSWADYTVIITALIYGGRFYIINMRRGRFNEYELPQVIATVGYKWKPKRIAIEDSVGVKWMGRELRREMDKLRISVPVEFCSLGLGTKARSKLMKAKPVARLLGDERMYFLNSCEGLEEIYTELEKFTGTSEDTHDDIVSGLSLLVEQFGGYADMDARVNSVNMDYVADQQAKDRHDLIYGLGRYSRFNSSNMGDDNPVTVFQQEQAGLSSPAQDTYFDPFQELLN